MYKIQFSGTSQGNFGTISLDKNYPSRPLSFFSSFFSHVFLFFLILICSLSLFSVFLVFSRVVLPFCLLIFFCLCFLLLNFSCFFLRFSCFYFLSFLFVFSFLLFLSSFFFLIFSCNSVFAQALLHNVMGNMGGWDIIKTLKLLAPSASIDPKS